MGKPNDIPQDIWDTCAALAAQPRVLGEFFQKNYIEPIARLVVAERERGQWEPIETAPKDGRDILVWDGDSVSLAAWDNGWWVLVEYTLSGVTHWMPLPSPPVET